MHQLQRSEYLLIDSFQPPNAKSQLGIILLLRIFPIATTGGSDKIQNQQVGAPESAINRNDGLVAFRQP